MLAPAAGPALRAETPPAAVEPPLPPRWTPRPAPAPGEPDAGARPRIDDLDDPCVTRGCEARSLDAFFRRLGAREGATRPVRVLHFGDSIVADDRITGRLRRRLQREFGDGGLGFVFLRPTARSYHPAGVQFEARGWYPGAVVGPAFDDHRYGLGGTGFEAPDEGPAATLRFQGGRHFALRYLASPDAGAVTVSLDGAPPTRLSLSAPGRGVVDAAPTGPREGAAPHTLTVRAAGGKVRLFGVVATEDGPGVTVENLGTVSNSARAMLHLDPAHWRDALRAEDPALVIVSLGTNEASHGALGPAERDALYTDALALDRRIREALPDAACLVTGPPDAAALREDGTVAQRPALAAIVSAQARAARDAGCAFFNTLNHMGGRGSIVAWHRQGLADGDLTHFTDAGGARLADALADALLSARDAARARIER